MVSGHFPSLYANRAPWATLFVLVIAGALVRHILNIRFAFPAWRGALAATLVGATVALGALMSMTPAPAESPASRTPERGGVVRPGTAHHRSPLRRLPLRDAVRSHLWPRAGGRDVRFTGADPHASRANQGARCRLTDDAACEPHNITDGERMLLGPLDRSGWPHRSLNRKSTATCRREATANVRRESVRRAAANKGVEKGAPCDAVRCSRPCRPRHAERAPRRTFAARFPHHVAVQRLAAAICRVAERAEEQRHVIVLRLRRDLECDAYLRVEARPLHDRRNTARRRSRGDTCRRRA